MSGMDGVMINAVKIRNGDKEYGYVGEIVSIEPKIVNDVIEKGYIPVVSSVAQGIDGSEVYNINADTVASELAVALGARKLILLTDVKGVMLDPSDEDSLLSHISLQT